MYPSQNQASSFIAISSEFSGRDFAFSLYEYSQQRMSGIEIAGLVLGAFPIILNCLDYYRKGFEPLEEWWAFRTHFIAFVDDINHQMMLYKGNMTRLLDPIIIDNDSLTSLVQNAKDPRWTDGSLTDLLEQRLPSELPRFLRIIQRMEEEICGLKKLLGVKNGEVRLEHNSRHLHIMIF